MSIDIAAEIKFSRVTVSEGEYFVRLQDADHTIIGKVVRTTDEQAWMGYTTEGRFTGSSGTRYEAARPILEAYELANGLRDSDGNRVTKEVATGLWFVADFRGVRDGSSRWTDKADAIAHLASLNVSDRATDVIDVQRCIANGAHLASSRHTGQVCPTTTPQLTIEERADKYWGRNQPEAQAAVEAPAESEIDTFIRHAIEDADAIEIRSQDDVTRTQLRRYRLTSVLSGCTIRELKDAISLPEMVAERGRLGRPLVKNDYVNILVNKALNSLTEDSGEEDLVSTNWEQRTITDRDIRERVVEPMLTDFDSDYDVDAIMVDLFARWPLSEWTYADLAYNHPGFDSDVFVEILQRHDLTADKADEPTFKAEITPVLVWGDGTVTGGVKELTDRLTAQAYGRDTDDEFTLYVTQGGMLLLASTRQLSQTTDEEEWINEVYGIYAGDATEPILTINLRIDGRA